MSFGEVLWFIIISFFFIMYLMALFSIFGDLFRDRDTSGGVKALWIIFLIFVPFLAMIIYLIARGNGMAERQMRQVADMQAQQEKYIRQVASTSGPATASPGQQIAHAKELLDSGAISQAEFEALKAKALA